MDDREQRIRQRAHQIWEQEGQPHGRDQEHWERAAGEIAAREAADQERDKHHPAPPTGDVGAASSLQPGGTLPGGGPGVGAGSLGSGAGSTMDDATGTARRPAR